ncbi:MAG: hypothetical protein Kow0062_08430 [Acidobacteriota bacterium]
MSGQRVERMEHLGIAVRDARSRLAFWADALGLEVEHVERVEGEGVRTWFLPVGESHIELLEPLGDEGPIARALERRGEGIHHVCLRVTDLDATLARLARGGFELAGDVREAARGLRAAFVHPRSTGGVLVELVEDPAGTPAGGGQAPFGPGALVVAYLRDPRERLFGVVRSLDARGLALEGLDLDAWEDWLSQRSRGERGPIAPSLQFFPIGRVEKLLADRDEPGLPSFARRFAERTGSDLRLALGEGGGGDAAD